jgi:hypothetical protein
VDKTAVKREIFRQLEMFRFLVGIREEPRDKALTTFQRSKPIHPDQDEAHR